jgi:hypothetical protein
VCVCTHGMLQLYCICVFVIVSLIPHPTVILANFGSMECNVMYVCMYVESVSSSCGGVDRYGIIRKLLKYVFEVKLQPKSPDRRSC